MDVHKKIGNICLSLPEVTEEYKAKRLHYCVRKKLFCGLGIDGSGQKYIGIKLEIFDSEQIIEYDDRFSYTRHLGKYGWIDMIVENISDWDEVKNYIKQSYCLIDPKTLAKNLKNK